MASPTQIEFLKVLACMAWADHEVGRSETSLIGRLMHEFQLSGEERLQVELYLDEPVGAEEAKRVTRRFLARVRRPGQRQHLVATVERLLHSDDRCTPEEQEWLQDLRDAVAESRGSFLLEGLRSVLRLSSRSGQEFDSEREAQLHDFVRNRVLFKLRRRLGAKVLEREASPDKLKELTLCAALLARVAGADEEFLPQERDFVQKLLRQIWGLSPSLAEAVRKVAMEVTNHGLDLFRLLQETKASLSLNQRRRLVEGLFGLALAEGRMTGNEVEEIRKIAYGLDLTHREFINAKLKILGRDRTG